MRPIRDAAQLGILLEDARCEGADGILAGGVEIHMALHSGDISLALGRIH